MDICTGYDSAAFTLVFFKTKEDGEVFRNYLSAVDGPYTVPIETISNFSSYLTKGSSRSDYESLVKTGYIHIYPRYILKEYVNNFKEVMED